MRLRCLLTCALALGALAAAAEAAAAPGIDARQQHQRARIAQGVAQGDLTRREAVGLAARQASIAAAERRMRADDGVLGPVERARLHHRLDHSSRAIAVQRHDRQRRW